VTIRSPIAPAAEDVFRALADPRLGALLDAPFGLICRNPRGSTRIHWNPIGRLGHAASMDIIATTPPPPYTAVIFTSVGTADGDGYAAMADRMFELAQQQPGYLGAESAREVIGITVSYWATEADAVAWKRVADHAEAQRIGRERWYERYRVRIATVGREYGRD
jgi:heme-degrading monooxygenase HmoA